MVCVSMALVPSELEQSLVGGVSKELGVAVGEVPEGETLGSVRGWRGGLRGGLQCGEQRREETGKTGGSGGERTVDMAMGALCVS